jgi:2-polyprenyl-6-methoxyphenol hydroxylase-like FAD-dependent oxidoreductase
MLSVIEGWDPVVRAAVAQVPEETLIDWKLLWRDPLRKWVSDKGRIVLVGDAAHPHLPTSGSGAAQAFEDSATLGAVLNLLGKQNVPTAFRAFEKIR